MCVNSSLRQTKARALALLKKGIRSSRNLVLRA